MKPLEVGEILTPKWTDELHDKVTKGNVYEVTKLTSFGGFYIINDEGKECFPISVSFKRISQTENS